MHSEEEIEVLAMGNRAKVIGSFTLAMKLLEFTSGTGLAQQEQQSAQSSFQDWRDIRQEPMFVSSAQYPDLSAAALHRTNGEVLQVDAGSRTLILQTGSFGEKVDFWVDPQAVVVQGRYPLEISDLKRGDQVRVEYLAKGDRYVAELVSVQ